MREWIREADWHITGIIMEKKLKMLFDYQRFEQNEKLEKLIQETENRYAKELSEEDLSLVSAAGEIKEEQKTFEDDHHI